MKLPCDDCGGTKLLHGEPCVACQGTGEVDDPSVVYLAKSSRSDDHYKIRQSPEGKLVCPCKGFGWRGKCRHIEEANAALLLQSQPVIRFDLHVGELIVHGQYCDLSNIQPGDLTSRSLACEEYLTRILGTTVRLVTGE